MRTLQKLPFCLVLGVAIGAIGCNTSSNGGTTPSPAAGTPVAATPQPQAAAGDQPPVAGAAQAAAPNVPDVSGMGDVSLAAIMQSTHQRIAQQAQMAERSAQSADVKKLSHDMFETHSDAINSEQSLFQRLGITPRPNAVSQQIDADTTQTMQTLHADRGPAFDRDYLDAQLQTLREAIPLFDRMYSVAKAPDLRAEIAHNRPDLVAGMQSVSRLKEQLEPGVTNKQGK